MSLGGVHPYKGGVCKDCGRPKCDPIHAEYGCDQESGDVDGA